MRWSHETGGGRLSLRIVRRAVIACALAAAGPTATDAQSVSVTPNQTQPSAGWTVTPMFVFSQSADSNVTLAGQGTPTTADDVAALSPSVDLGYLGRLTMFSAGYSGSATRYFTVNQLDTYDQRLYANLKQQVARHVKLFAQESGGWMPTTDTVEFAGIPFVRVGSRVETLEAGGTIQLAKFTEMTTGYRFEWVDFDRSNPLAAKLFGGHSNGLFGGLRQQVSPRLFLGGSYDVRRAIVAAGAQQFNILNAEGTVEYHLSPEFVLSGGLGVARIAGSLPLDGTRTGPAWHAGANYKFDQVLAYASYRRSWVPSYGIGGTIQNQELSVGARLPIAFRDRLVVGGSFSWRRNDPLVLTENRLTSTWVSAYGSYSIAPWLRVQGYASRSTQDSHLGGVLRNQVGFQIVTLAPMRFK